MRVHILGICGTFMSGVAILAKQCGHEVTGSDINVYPPMSTQLMEQGIRLMQGFDPLHINAKTDCVIIGNVITRGNPIVEYVLENQIPYMSGPAWLAANILKHRWVLAVAGTHGKTSTSSMLTWILDSAGMHPGFLIGGMPENFGVSARLGSDPYFVIEADEYDSAFFDKRAKFIHYQAKTAILNNLEYDHADIYPDLDAIKRQFHYFLRTIPGNGLIVQNDSDANVRDVIKMGCWTPTVGFAGEQSEWRASLLEKDGSVFKVLRHGKEVAEVNWDLIGMHNVQNALGAIAAASHAGVSAEKSAMALKRFKNVKRRMEMKGSYNNIVIYDDFAHHPTAISQTLTGLRAKVGEDARIIAILEFGSYTMRSGLHKEKIQEALKLADMVVCKTTDTDWGLKAILDQFTQPTSLYDNVDTLVDGLAPSLRPGDHVLVMSNTGFGDLHRKLFSALENQKVV